MAIKFPNPFKARFFSAAGFFYRAVLIVIVFGLLHLAGLREYTSFITGTSSGNVADILGMAYFLFYSLSVFVTPILVIASGFMLIFRRIACVED